VIRSNVVVIVLACVAYCIHERCGCTACGSAFLATADGERSRNAVVSVQFGKVEGSDYYKYRISLRGTRGKETRYNPKRFHATSCLPASGLHTASRLRSKDVRALSSALQLSRQSRSLTRSRLS
jgi:hypothetical protein